MDWAQTKMIAGRTASIARIMAGERARRRRVTRAAQVPHSTAAITEEWLTDVLCKDVPGARVESMQLGDRTQGSSTRHLVQVEYNAAGREAGLPNRLYSKASEEWRARLLLSFTRADAAEIYYYRDMRPGLDMEAPLSYYGGIEADKFRSLLLLEDVATSKGATFGNPLTLYVDRQLAESQLDVMSTYHAKYWNYPRWEQDFPWLVPALTWQQNVNAGVPFEERCLVAMEKASHRLPSELLDRRTEFFPGLMRSLEINLTGVPTLLHSDVHIGNWYMTGDRRMGILDWHCMTRGSWALDFAYAMSSALTVEDRREWEEDLLRKYLELLRDKGVDAPGFDDAWLAYRQQMFHAWAFWLITLTPSKMQPDMQPEDLTEENVARIGHAMNDLKSLDSLAKQPSSLTV